MRRVNLTPYTVITLSVTAVQTVVLHPIHQLRLSSSSNDSKPQDTQCSTEATPKAQPVVKPPVGKFHKYAREHGFFFAVYFTIVCELFVIAMTYLVHQRWIAGGDAATLVSSLGLSKWIDVAKYADKSISFYGYFDLSGRLAMNYAVCSLLGPMFYPAILPVCLATTPALKKIVFFWRKPKVTSTA
eukprot:GILI01039236.1.p1 GENE.GILI01039236.1~~GILI01039236.1.p1  ORF type:complete len:186 (+),score=8.21 GILI01039236.1:28-585(+)